MDVDHYAVTGKGEVQLTEEYHPGYDSVTKLPNSVSVLS